VEAWLDKVVFACGEVAGRFIECPALLNETKVIPDTVLPEVTQPRGEDGAKLFTLKILEDARGDA